MRPLFGWWEGNVDERGGLREEKGRADGRALLGMMLLSSLRMCDYEYMDTMSELDEKLQRYLMHLYLEVRRLERIFSTPMPSSGLDDKTCIPHPPRTT